MLSVLPFLVFRARQEVSEEELLGMPSLEELLEPVWLEGRLLQIPDEQIQELEPVPEEHEEPAQPNQEEQAAQPVVEPPEQERREERGESTQRKNKRKRDLLHHELERRGTVLERVRGDLRQKEREVEELKRRVEGNEEVLRLRRKIRQMEVEWREERDWQREVTIKEREEWARREQERCWEVGSLRARIAGLEEELEEIRREKVERGYARFVAHAANRQC